jgi:hypothetical protein
MTVQGMSDFLAESTGSAMEQDLGGGLFLPVRTPATLSAEEIEGGDPIFSAVISSTLTLDQHHEWTGNVMGIPAVNGLLSPRGDGVSSSLNVRRVGLCENDTLDVGQLALDRQDMENKLASIRPAITNILR